MKKSPRQWLPSKEALSNHRFIRWLGPAVLRPRLWRLSRRGLALGLAVGVFFGFLVPVAQIPLSAVAAVVLRAHLPSAVASTLVTNPVTFGPVYYAAWRVGGVLMGEPASEAEQPTEAAPQAGQSWWQSLTGVGRPLILGLVVFAVVGSVFTYFVTVALWDLRLWWLRRRRDRGRTS